MVSVSHYKDGQYVFRGGAPKLCCSTATNHPCVLQTLPEFHEQANKSSRIQLKQKCPIKQKGNQCLSVKKRPRQEEAAIIIRGSICPAN